MKLAAALAAFALAARASAATPAPAHDDRAWTLIPGMGPEGLAFEAGTSYPMHPAPGGLALVVVDHLWHLVPARIQGDWATPGDTNFVRLTATPADALAYLHLPELAAGKVDTPDMRFKGVRHELDKPVLPVSFKGRTWRFEVKDKHLSVTDGQRRQALGWATDPDTVLRVFLAWAGDLDHDGQLDFIIESDGDDSNDLCVWLSSRAAPGELVGKVNCP